MRPMKGVKVEDTDLGKIRFPLGASIKFDGWRCLIVEGKALTAALKPIPNNFVRESLEAMAEFIEGRDGELLLRGDQEFNDVQSAFQSEDGQPDFVFHVFDYWNMGDAPFSERLERLKNDTVLLNDRFMRVEHVICNNLEELQAFEDEQLEAGHEGIMTRELDKPYKFGKASIKQQNCLKRKPMVEGGAGRSECEAVVIGFVEQQKNNNVQTKNELGLAKRSSHKAGMVGKGTLGKFICLNKRFGEFKVGTGRGMSDKFRQDVWNDRDGYMNIIINFSFQEKGTLEGGKPRLPIFRRVRDPRDLDPVVYAELMELVEQQGVSRES